MSECSHSSVHVVVNSQPSVRVGHPFGRGMPSSSSIELRLKFSPSICSLQILISPVAGVLAGIPCVRCASRTSLGMEFVFMLEGCSLNTVFVLRTDSAMCKALDGSTIAFPSQSFLMPQPDQSVVPMRARTPFRPFQSSCFCQL